MTTHLYWKAINRFSKLVTIGFVLSMTTACGEDHEVKESAPDLPTSKLIGQLDKDPLVSIDLAPYTISKVATATNQEKSYIVASSYEGTLLGVTYSGHIGWINPLSGFMNRDLYTADLDGDGADEILAANADGTLYCLNAKGDLLWEFRPSETPMGAVSVIQHEGVPHVVCGGYDKNIYYLSAKGELIKTIASSTYSIDKPWGENNGKRLPENFEHIANFIRTAHNKDGNEILVIQGNLFSKTTGATLYFFEPLADKPYKTLKNVSGISGDMQIADIDNDGTSELLCGTSGMIQDAKIVALNLKDDTKHELNLIEFRRKLDSFGYRVAQTVAIQSESDPVLFTSFGSRIILSSPDLNFEDSDLIEVGYSFNDLTQDPNNGKIVLGSAQSGGSCVHILDATKPDWKAALETFQPNGKLATLIQHAATTREQLSAYSTSTSKEAGRTVYMMTESLKTQEVKDYAYKLEETYGNPIFLHSFYLRAVEDWDRSGLGNEVYAKRRDKRRKYTLTQEQVVEEIRPHYETNRKGVSFWGGHGNDPYMLQSSTIMKAADLGKAAGKKSVFVYPELESYSDDFAFALNDYIFPLADHLKDKDALIYLRNKHTFWQAVIYKPLWAPLLLGEYADVFIPSMEETTDKSMELSVAARVGIWASGVTNQWGSRCARDNASFDRLREHSHQMVPNHFLRTQIYTIALGSTYLDNFAVDQEYFSVLYGLIAKGVLYVPERNEIVSLSPVHLSMTDPDPQYVEEGNNVKWTTFYDAKHEAENPLVFSRLNGTWPGSPLTDWDFSSYAAGVKERRLNFLPPYEDGLVLITPVQNGPHALNAPSRGKLVDQLHPLYQNILKEYITNGKNYLSTDGKKEFPPTEYYKEIQRDIEEASKQLPLTVSGDVAWVAAQTSPKNLRLTLIDSGYINPKDRTAVVQFQTVTPKSIVDLLNKETFTSSEAGSISIPITAGHFRFIDIELTKPL